MFSKYVLFVILVVFQSAIATAQDVQHFDVATFKPSAFKPGEPAPIRFDPLPGSRLVIQNMSLRTLISIAYGVLRKDLIQGGPTSLDNRYTIEAKSDNSQTMGDTELLLALRTLLQERLRLRVHWETKSLSVLAIVTSPDGPKLKRSSPDAEWKGPQWFSRNKLSLPAVTMSLLASTLTSKPDLQNEIVIDQTGLTGNFDIDLEFRPDALPGVDSDPQLSQLPSIYQVFKNLGLKLISSKASLPLLVIDYAEPPSDN